MTDISELENFLGVAPGTTVLTGKKIILRNTFDNFSSLTLVNCRVQCDPGAILFVSSAGNLTCSNTKFFACSQMWEGIICSETPTVSLTESCEIEDAVRALNLNRVTSASVTIHNTTFNRNDVGISAVTPLGSSPLVLNLTDFSSNLFQCTSDLLVGAPNGNNISTSGMEVQNVVAAIGNKYDNNAATFDGLRVGIFSTAATVSINGGCKFLNMVRGKETSTFLPHGWGIQAFVGSNVRLGTYMPCTFANNNAGGIASSASSLTVANSTFVNGLEGVMSVGNTGAQRVWINNNQFTLTANSRNAIIADRSAVALGVARVSIFGNTINRTAAYFIDPNQGSLAVKSIRAIQLTCRTPGVSDIASIQQNEYTDITGLNPGTDSDIGIEARSFNAGLVAVGNNVHINDNTVLYRNPIDGVLKIGIAATELSGSTGIQVDDNWVERVKAGKGPTFFAGINVRNVQGASICSNTVSNLNNGMVFEANNTMAGFRSNHFGPCLGAGWFVIAGGLGAQIRRSNTWDAQPGSAFAARLALPELIFVNNYRTESIVVTEWF